MQFPGATPEEIAFAKRRARTPRRSLRIDASFFVSLLISLALVVPPALIGWSIARTGSDAAILLALGAGATASVILTFSIGKIWRRFATDDRLFVDATITGWLRRARADRAVSRAREVFSDPSVAPIELHVDRLTAIAKSLEARDARTHRHSTRMASSAVAIAREMDLSPEEIARVRAAARLHDIGALKLPAFVHSTESERVARASASAELLAFTGDRKLIESVRYQRERFDGCGAPDGLVGSQIPLTARILAVADTYDLVAHEHGQASALKELEQGAGIKYDPRIVEALSASASGGPGAAIRGAAAGAFPRAAQGAIELLRGTASVAAAASIATTAVVAGGVGVEQHRDKVNAHAGAAASAGALTAPAAATTTKRHSATRRGDRRGGADHNSSGKPGVETDSHSGSGAPTSGAGTGQGGSASSSSSDSSSGGETAHTNSTSGSSSGGVVGQVTDDLGQTVGGTTQTLDKTVGAVGEVVDNTTSGLGGAVGGVVGGLTGGKKK